MFTYIILIFSVLTSITYAKDGAGIDSNCNKFVKENNLIEFSNSSKIYGTYKSRKKDYDYLKSKNYEISEYYQNLEGYTPTGNYEIDKYHALFDTERKYNWNHIKSSYKNTIESVNTEVTKDNYRSKYYDLNGNFRSTHTCTNNTDCLAYKAYCSEEVAKKSITDKMKQYMRMNQHCLRGNKDVSEYEEFINTCDDVIKNLNYVKAQGNSLNKIAKTKTPETENFFSEVYHEFSEFKDNWDALKKDMQDKLAGYKKEQERLAEEELLKKELEHKNALLDPVRDEFLKCAGISDARDKDVKGRNLADGLCKRLGDPVSPLTMEYQTIDFENDQVIDELEKDLNNIQNFVLDDLAAEISQKAFHESAMSVWAITNPTPRNEKEAEIAVCKHTPKLCKMDDFKLILKDAFSEFQNKIKKKPLKVLNAVGKEDVLKSDVLPLMNKMNAICSNYNKYMAKMNYEKQAEEERIRRSTVAVDNTYVHNQTLINFEAEQNQTEFNTRQDGLMGKLLPLYDEVLNSELGYLFITDRFKEGIGTFSINKMHEKCMSGKGNGKIFNPANSSGELVSMNDLAVADKEFKTLVTDELSKIDDDYGKIRDLEENEIANFLGADNTKKGEMLEQYLKTNPLTIVKMLQDNPNSDFAKTLCSYILSIEDEDYRKRIRDWILAGVGAVAGVALMFTGIGSPVGASLLALSIGATSLEVMNIIEDKNQHAKNAQYIEQAAATAQYELDMAINDALKEKEESKGTINDILWIAGPDLLGFGIGKIAKSMKLLKRGHSMTKLARLDNVIDVANDGRKLADATDEASQVMRGLKRMQKVAGENHLKNASQFKNLTNEETLQLGALFSRLDDVQAARLLKKFNELENATEMKRFLNKLHVNVDDFIDAGKVNLNKVVAEVESSKIRKLKSFDEITEEVNKVTHDIVKQKKSVPTKPGSKIDNYTESFTAHRNDILNYKAVVPKNSSFSRKAMLKIDELEKNLEDIASMGPVQQERVKAAMNSLTYSVDKLDEIAYIEKVSKKIANLQKQNIPVVKVKTAPFSNTTKLNVDKYKKMTELEGEFDILARKASSPPDGIIHEVDAAFISKGIPQNTFKIGDSGELVIDNAYKGEKVMAVGHKGAVNFAGDLSNTGGERFFGVVYEKGFVKNFGVDLRIKGNIKGGGGNNPNANIFNQNYAPDGKVFTVRGEKATKELGQVHIQQKGGFTQMEIDGKMMSQTDWANKYVKGIVEFDADGNIIKFIAVD